MTIKASKGHIFSKARPCSQTGHRGVRKCRGKYEAQVYLQGKRVFRQLCGSVEMAVKARADFLKTLFPTGEGE